LRNPARIVCGRRVRDIRVHTDVVAFLASHDCRVRVELRIEVSTVDPIEGTVTCDDRHDVGAVAFVGWLGLLRAIEDGIAAIDRTRAVAGGQSPS
jgi:hypothetical protein